MSRTRMKSNRETNDALAVQGIDFIGLAVVGAMLGGILMGGLAWGALGEVAAMWGTSVGIAAGSCVGWVARWIGPTRARAQARSQQHSMLRARARDLVGDAASLFHAGQAQGDLAAGEHNDQPVRFWAETGGDAFVLNCSVSAPREGTYLEAVSAKDLGVEPFAGPGEMVVRSAGIRAVWNCAQAPPEVDACRRWVGSILAEADARLVAESQRIERLAELVEDGRPSAFGALVAEQPEHPRLAEFAERLTESREPATRLVGARWLGPPALEAMIDDLTCKPVWRAQALRAWSEATELPVGAIQRWSAIPALGVELLIDQMRRGAIETVALLADSASNWDAPDKGRLQVLANATIERGPEAEAVARRLFEVQPAVRQYLAQALGEIGGMRSLATLRATHGTLDWSQVDAVGRAEARIINRIGDAAAGMLTLGQHEGEAGGLSLGAEAAGGLAVAQQSERE